MHDDQAERAGIGGRLHAYKIQISVPDGERAPVSVELALGGVPGHAVGRLFQSASSVGVATAFRINTEGLLHTPDRVSEVLLMGRDDQAQLTGAGWSPVEADSGGPYRWMTASEARLLLPLATKDGSRLTLQALLPERAPGAPSTVALRLNGRALPPQPLFDGWHSYDWVLPPGIVQSGPNAAVIIIDRLPNSPSGIPAPKGIAVAEVVVRSR